MWRRYAEKLRTGPAAVCARTALHLQCTMPTISALLARRVVLHEHLLSLAEKDKTRGLIFRPPMLLWCAGGVVTVGNFAN